MNKLTTKQTANILRFAGFALAAGFLIWMKQTEATMPEEGFMGRAFCNLMAAVGALVFTIGSVMRFRAVMKERNEDPENQ